MFISTYAFYYIIGAMVYMLLCFRKSYFENVRQRTKDNIKKNKGMDVEISDIAIVLTVFMLSFIWPLAVLFPYLKKG